MYKQHINLIILNIMDTQSARNLLASALFLFGVQRVPEKTCTRSWNHRIWHETIAFSERFVLIFRFLGIKSWKNLVVSKNSCTFALAIEKHRSLQDIKWCHSSVGRATDWKSVCPRFDSWWYHLLLFWKALLKIRLLQGFFCLFCWFLSILLKFFGKRRHIQIFLIKFANDLYI